MLYTFFDLIWSGLCFICWLFVLAFCEHSGKASDFVRTLPLSCFCVVWRCADYLSCELAIAFSSSFYSCLVSLWFHFTSAHFPLSVFLPCFLSWLLSAPSRIPVYPLLFLSFSVIWFLLPLSLLGYSICFLLFVSGVFRTVWCLSTGKGKCFICEASGQLLLELRIRPRADFRVLDLGQHPLICPLTFTPTFSRPSIEYRFLIFGILFGNLRRVELIRTSGYRSCESLTRSVWQDLTDHV